jgi:hypothetical protein
MFVVGSFVMLALRQQYCTKAGHGDAECDSRDIDVFTHCEQEALRSSIADTIAKYRVPAVVCVQGVHTQLGLLGYGRVPFEFSTIPRSQSIRAFMSTVDWGQAYYCVETGRLFAMDAAIRMATTWCVESHFPINVKSTYMRSRDGLSSHAGTGPDFDFNSNGAAAERLIMRLMKMRRKGYETARFYVISTNAE